MDLPQDLEKQLYEELSQWEKEKQMPHISTAERIGLQKGEEKGRAEGKAEGIVQGKTEGIVQGKADTLVKILERRCKIKLPTDLDTALRTSTDLARLEHWVELALETTSLEEFRRLGQV